MKKLLIILLTLVILTSTASAATLNVGSTAKYKTIQSAVNAAHAGDTINVAAGTYKETVQINDKTVSIIGQTGKYPIVYGFSMGWTTSKLGSANVNGFKITKYGVTGGNLGAFTIRNNYFYNCDVGFGGPTCSSVTVMNNKFSNGGISIDDRSGSNVITGNTFTESKIGVNLFDGASCSLIKENTFSSDKTGLSLVGAGNLDSMSITKNVFSGCQVGVLANSVPAGLLGNTYKGNKVNIKLVK